MKSVMRNAFILGLAVAAASVSIAACSSKTDSTQTPEQEGTGIVGMALTLPGGLSIATVSYTINGPHTYTGVVNVASASTISFVVPNVAAGAGYTITLTAITTDGSVTCLGTSATFSVVARQTTAVNVFMACTTSIGDAGAVLVNGIQGNCATWGSAVANPSTTTTGSVVALSATASAPNAAALTYAWSASAGSIDTPSASAANFTCPATPGTVTLTLVTGDGVVPAGVTCPATNSTTTITVTCNGTVDAGAVDAADAAVAVDAADSAVAVDAADSAVVLPPVGPCTATNTASNCVPCAGNASGICSTTEAAFVSHDIAAGHKATLDCYSCLYNASCVDDTAFGDTGHECGDMSASNSTLCLNTLNCALANSCVGTGAGCYCGTANPGNSCQTATANFGPCQTTETAGLGVTDNASVLKDYTDTTRPSGMANQIFACALANGCSACVQ